MINRREFLGSALALGTSGVVCAAGRTHSFPASAYSRAIVIDALSDPSDDSPQDADGLMSASALAGVKASGVTAINLTVNLVGNGPDRFQRTVNAIGYWERELEAHAAHFMKVLHARDLQSAKASGRLGLIYGFQDTTMLDGDLERLQTFHGFGVRIVQPVYNRRNVMGDGCLEPADGGLSTLGRELIAELNRLNILVDLSHAGPRTIKEGIETSKVPMAITHTGCRALVDVPRNTHDRELKALADRGGVAGIFFMPFLRTSGQPHAADLIAHIEHAVDVCGEDHVGLGTDGGISGVTLDAKAAEGQRKFFEARSKAGIAAPGEAADIFNLVPEYNEPKRFLTLANDLSDRGWPERRIEKILGANFARLFAEVWKG